MLDPATASGATAYFNLSGPERQSSSIVMMLWDHMYYRVSSLRTFSLNSHVVMLTWRLILDTLESHTGNEITCSLILNTLESHTGNEITCSLILDTLESHTGNEITCSLILNTLESHTGNEITRRITVYDQCDVSSHDLVLITMFTVVLTRL